MSVQILWRRGTSEAWAAANPVLGQGEVGLDLTVVKVKVGDGVSAWLDLDWSFDGVEAVDGTVAGVWQGTLAAYDALPVKHDDVVYVIKEG